MHHSILNSTCGATQQACSTIMLWACNSFYHSTSSHRWSHKSCWATWKHDYFYPSASPLLCGMYVLESTEDDGVDHVVWGRCGGWDAWCCAEQLVHNAEACKAHLRARVMWLQRQGAMCAHEQCIRNAVWNLWLLVIIMMNETFQKISTIVLNECNLSD